MGDCPSPRVPLPFDRPAMSHQEIANRLGLSQSRVQQLEAQALRKCRQWLEAHGITASCV
jgi:DNA-directed RNA polymerase specialized sigma24 family protein